METRPGNSYTAAQIAAALGISKQAVLTALADTPASSTRIVRGNETRVWQVESFPETFNARFRSKAIELGYEWQAYREACLNLTCKGIGGWKPTIKRREVSLAELTDSCIEQARTLRTAQQPALQRKDDLLISPAEHLRLGLEEYRRAFGHPVSSRHWQRLFDRTLHRDGGAEDWDRLETYLPDRLARKVAAVHVLPTEQEFKELLGTIRSFKQPTSPTLTEKALLWTAACEWLERAEAKCGSRRSRRELLNFLNRHVAFIAKSSNAMRVTLDRKFSCWQESGGDFVELKDGRTQRKGSGYELPETERNALVATAALFGGGMQMAWREYHSQLSDVTREHYPNRFRIPGRVAAKISHLVKLEKTALRGPKAVRVAGAYVSRDPDGIAAGDWDQSDDMTPVNYWWEESETAARGFWFGQGQWLPWIDERSWFIYSHTLLSDPYYDGFNIRNSWTQKAAEWGLPRRGLSLENGIWRRARVLRGRDSDIDSSETEAGLRGHLGLDFHHYRDARGKVIERTFAELQNYFQAAPGYVGRVQMLDRYEPEQKKIALVKAGKAHPAELGFQHKSQMMLVFERFCHAFNERPMHGKYHRGRSPRQVFEDCFTDKLIQMPPALRWLLASNRLVETVGGNGVKFSFGKRVFKYKGDELGRRIGEKVVVYFNPERPETACCTDTNGSNPFVVEEEIMVAPHDADPEQLGKAMAQNAAQNRFRRELHRSLKPYYNSAFFQNMFLPTMVSPETVEMSNRFAAENRRIESVQKEAGAQRSQARKAFGKIGMPLPGRLRPGQTAAAERLASLLNEPEEAT